MGDIIRTFFAVDIPLTSKLDSFLDYIRKEFRDEKIKWVEKNQIHITLKFLGDTDKKHITSIIDKIAGELTTLPTLTLIVRGFGVFKNSNVPRILWLGIEDSTELKNIFKLIEKQIEDFGYEKEGKEFIPHLTIGRIKYLNNREKLKRISKEFIDYTFVNSTIHEIVFYKSELFQSGPVYTALSRIGLTG